MKASTKKISRRDALKAAAAALGAAALANLPDKWSKPSLSAGVLPAHAQTSEFLIECNDSITAGNFISLPELRSGFMGATLFPALAGIDVTYLFSGSGVTIHTPNGTTTSGAGGVISVFCEVTVNTLPGNVEITFIVGGSSCTQTINFVSELTSSSVGSESSSWHGK